jgi:hypothetical protein
MALFRPAEVSMTAPVVMRRISRYFGFQPSLSVLRKATIAPSSASVNPSLPVNRVFMCAVVSGAGQQLTPSPASFGWQRGSVSRVL